MSLDVHVWNSPLGSFCSLLPSLGSQSPVYSCFALLLHGSQTLEHTLFLTQGPTPVLLLLESHGAGFRLRGEGGLSAQGE